MFHNLVSHLKECDTIRDVNRLFINQHFFIDIDNLFFSQHVKYKLNTGKIKSYKIRLKGLPALVFRVLVYLKFNGFLQSIPRGEGKERFLSNLHIVLSLLTKNKNKLNSMNEICSKSLDDFINMSLDKGLASRTISAQLYRLKEWIYFANNLLPFFLRLDESIFNDSIEYAGIRRLAYEEWKNKDKIANSSNTYDLKDLKIIISNAINFIELYNNEVIKIAIFFMKIKDLNEYRRNLSLKSFFMKNKNDFKEPSLIKLSEVFKNKEGQYCAGISVLSKLIKKLEVCSISIVLMLTGMRSSELIALDRNLDITNDEHFNLKRVIFKTASTEDGEILCMPIPNICKIALETLSKLAMIKDGNENSCLLVSDINEKTMVVSSNNRINNMLRWYCADLGITTAITAHQFRHSMAFLIVHIFENDGLELAKMFLGHTSINMTLQYMGHYNNELKESIKELNRRGSKFFVDKITDQINDNKKLFGKNGSRLNPRHKFVGEQSDSFIHLLRKGLLQLIDEEKLAILQTPISLCLHDLSKPEELVCQRGFNLKEIALNGPFPANCEGANCANAIFFDEHIEEIKKQLYSDIDADLKQRLEQNTYFIDAGGFDQEPYSKLVKEYDEYKKDIL